MTKRILPILALITCSLSTAAAGNDDVAIAIDKAITPLNSAVDGYQTWFEGEDIDPAERREQSEAILLDTADDCSAAVSAALKAGVPADTVVQLYRSTIVLGEAERTVCNRLRLAARTAIDEAKAAEEARIAPFKKALKGDRLTLWMKYQAGFHGKGCKELTTPAALAKAKAWYIILEDDSDVVYRWTTRQYKFKGNKLVTSGHERTGTGRNPPSKACP